MFVSLALEMLHIVNISHITYKDKLNLKIRELFFKKKKEGWREFFIFWRAKCKTSVYERIKNLRIKITRGESIEFTTCFY
jgi:hypothetical protein